MTPGTLPSASHRSAADFEALYQAHSAAAYGLAVRIVGRTQAAEDVVQDAFLDLWRSDTYRPERGPMRPFLLGIVRNRAIDRIRRDRRLPLPADTRHELREQADRRPTPDAEVAELEESMRVHRALDTLPREQFRVLDLAYFGGLSHAGIAKRVGLPLGTVKGRMRLGLEKLRAELARDGMPGSDQAPATDAVRRAS